MYILLIILPIILVLLSQSYIKSSYNKYSSVEIKSKLTGKEAARKILDAYGLSDVSIRKVNGELTDNFNPKTKVVSLSESIYDTSSIASVSVAAHECGHVIQHKEKYAFIVLRSILVPVVNISSKLGYIILIIGFAASIFDVAFIGFILMCAALLFQLITLPTEYNASRRARSELLKLNIINDTELSSVRSMLNAAAFTYLASFFASLLQMFRLFLNMRRND